jgi:AcrR family transcriptional regulator
MEEQDIKDRIIQGAKELFMKYGVRSVSMDDVARHLSVSKKTLYQYFADKDELVTTAVTLHMDSDMERYNNLHKTSKNAIEELVMISSIMKQEFQKLHPSLLFDLQKYHAKAWAAWMGHKQVHIKNSIVRNLRQGMEEGFFRTDLQVEVLALLRLEMIQMTFDESIFPPEKFNLTEVSLQLFDHFVYGLLTDKGRKVYEKYKLQTNNLESIPQAI